MLAAHQAEMAELKEAHTTQVNQIQQKLNNERLNLENSSRERFTEKSQMLDRQEAMTQQLQEW